MDANDSQAMDVSGAAPAAARPPLGGPLRRAMARFRSLGPVTLLFAGMFGALVGLGAFTFGYGKGAAYLSSDPRACVNCHVMQDHFDAWQHSSHHRVATCNDCHLPHHPIGKWVTKADNGFFHSLAFTLMNFHDPIQIKPRNRRVTQGTCLHCHESVVHQMLPEDPNGEMLACIHCHRDVGHAQR
jgi:cytochrome c nitrite reductase small subunit